MLKRIIAQSPYAAGAALACVHFGPSADAPTADAALKIEVPLAPMAAQRALVDVFPARGPVHVERMDDCEVASDGRLLVGCVRLDERASGGLQAAARRAYASIFDQIDRSPCRAPLRFWNYVPRINEELDGLERYRHFNIGRQEAFLAAGRAAFEGAPAACALGSRAGDLVVYFVAARDASTALENPRQVSAYHYPPDYGPRSPTFSRATLYTAGTPALFVSGTASIVGHRSQHPYDPVAQTRETLVNIHAVIDAANARLGTAAFAPEGLAYTVYVRNRAQLPAIRAQFERAVGAESVAAQQALYLEADICRAELLVEIEAHGEATAVR